MVHGLQDRGGVGWKVQNLYKTEFSQNIFFEVGRMSRSIIEDKEGLERKIVLQKVLFYCWSKDKVDPLSEE